MRISTAAGSGKSEMMNRTEILKELFALRDAEYRDFQAKLIPNKDPGRMIGVRTPDLRALAKKLKDDPEIDSFLAELPHEYFDEDQLHAFIISEEKDFSKCIGEVEDFLPFADNWATCDQLSPKVFRKNTSSLLPHIREWLRSEKTYTVRFGIGMPMQHFLDDHFDPSYPETVASIRSEEYYINMMIAWYFATALAKQYDAVIPYIEERMLDPWTHNKTIQKCVESRRITDAQKECLRSMKIKTK